MRAWLWSIPLASFPVYSKTGTFALNKVGSSTLTQVKPGDTVFAYLSGKQVIAGMFEVTSAPFEDSTPLISDKRLPYRIRVRPVVRLSEEAWVRYEAFSSKLEVVQGYSSFRAVVQKVLHPLPKVDEKVLEFLVRARQGKDLEEVLEAYEAYRTAKEARAESDPPNAGVTEAEAVYVATLPFSWPDAMAALQRSIANSGFVYAPWHIATYVTALRTKPFVILAGVTGIGKSKLPALVEAATGGTHALVPVRPDWTDSSEVIGYVDLQQHFRPGAVLQAAHRAEQHPNRHLTCILDEMNLARVEQYFAEMLSLVEDRHLSPASPRMTTPPLVGSHLANQAGDWQNVVWRSNFAVVGTVNMDESAHGFSRKVLDRAFTLELAEVDLHASLSTSLDQTSQHWPAHAWLPYGLRAHDLDASKRTQAIGKRVNETLTALNVFLTPAQFQVAYRTRDEILFFVLHAQDYPDAFQSTTSEHVDPFDLALHMKVLPRLIGGSPALRTCLLSMLGWTAFGAPFTEPSEARDLVNQWVKLNRPFAFPNTRFPRTVARLCLMWERFQVDGYTAFWI